VLTYIPLHLVPTRVLRTPASSTGLLLKTLGLNVTAIKIDPYMNIDAGTMSPTEHGELALQQEGASLFC
jgi:CTP synthase (UTP-ammonia lyase)